MASVSPSAMKGLNFPVQLHRALEDMERNGESHIASWRPHGRCFQVHNRDEFTATILPRCFNMTKFSSFQRQLNIYSFKRVHSGPDERSFYHEQFLRGLPELAREIKRVPVKGHVADRVNDAATAAAATTTTTTTASSARSPRMRNCPPPDFSQLPPLPQTRSIVGTGNVTGSAGLIRAVGFSVAPTVATSSTGAEGLVASATSGPWAHAALAAQDQYREELLASTQMDSVPSLLLPPTGPFMAAGGHLPTQVSTITSGSLGGIPDVQLILAYLQHQEREQNMERRDALLWRLQAQQQRTQQLARQSLVAAANRQISSLIPVSATGSMSWQSEVLDMYRMRQQQQSDNLLWQLRRLQGQNGTSR